MLASHCGDWHARGMKPPLTPPLDFMMQVKGTLPEIISASDLPKLNHALEFLFADLRQASQLFHEQHGDNGRKGAAAALGAMCRFIVLFQSPYRESLHVPILRLEDALLRLASNSVDPMLRPVPRPKGGRAVSSEGRRALKGMAAATVKRLQDAGIDRPKAYKAVASELNKLGVRPERGRGSVTVRTVRLWCEDVAADVARTGAAALTYDWTFTPEETARFAALPKDRRVRFALTSLAEYVRGIFPEIAGGRKPVKPAS
jgi:hypothetical protein